ncbi:sigma-70 region 4 domain-containing protein [Modicisalibacter luteus]|uniref:Sigma-70 region 4 domain-containing protein n=1 Tax=Modicisalibacter luteus TaxID=453962 RepID=A0ABV7M3Q5_9GAMM|nr:sigma-70 region 4 domain-containing protein [Halomonas lutea]GHA87176.1 hypothetical protein GCM10007159_05540 [Halomonas lutea]
MHKGTSKPLVLLQEPFLGEAVSDVLAIGALLAEVEQASVAMAAPLLRLCNGIDNEQEISLSATSLAWRMRGPLNVLHSWALADDLSIHHHLESASLEDFINFVAMARSLAEAQGAPVPGRLLHLLGLAMVRARLERHVGLSPSIDLPILHSTDGLSVVEIAAVCGLKLTTVRNAVSRREMVHTREDGVPLDEALDWMVQRSGFLYSHANAACQDRRINGRLASDWLAKCPEVIAERYISRLRLSMWRIPSNSRRIALNAEGVRNCVLLLPGIEIDDMQGLGLERLEDRSDDPAAEMHREALLLGPDESLWQCQAPTLRVLASLIDRLACVGEVEMTPVDACGS